MKEFAFSTALEMYVSSFRQFQINKKLDNYNIRIIFKYCLASYNVILDIVSVFETSQVLAHLF